VFHLPIVTVVSRAVAVILCLLTALPSFAQETAEDSEPAEPAAADWSGRFDLGLAVTEGNSNSETFNLKGRIVRRLQRSVLRFKAEGIKADTADDRFRLVEPGITWLPGEIPPVEDAASSFVDPAIEPDVEQYFLEFLLERTLKKDPKRGTGKLKWHSGISWDRNVEAGLIGRSVAFAGFGHDWWDSEDLGFRTRYGLSYTHRNERTKDLNGKVVGCVITIYKDRTFDFEIKSSPASVLICEAAGIEKGSSEPNKNKVGSVSTKDVEEIAKVKMPDLNCESIDAAVKIVAGTARSMGLDVTA